MQLYLFPRYFLVCTLESRNFRKIFRCERISIWAEFIRGLTHIIIKSSAGYQLTRSLLAIGSGETTGKGFGTREVYLPESHTDFIFSVVGEEFGFIGASVLISLFFLLIYHITKVGMETKNDFYTYVCVGVISMITFHVFQNIGMTIGLLADYWNSTSVYQLRRQLINGKYVGA